MAKQVLIDGLWFVKTTCCRCQVTLFLTQEIYTVADQKKEQGSFYCPNGHGQHYVTGESELDKMRRERDRLAQQIAYKDDVIREAHEDRDATQRRLNAAKGQVTKIKNRIGNGVCPCCSRTFANLARHMATQHKDYTQANQDEALKEIV